MRLRLPLRSDAGFTLIELSVVTILFALVTVTVGGILIGATTAERTVRSVASATNAGQLVARTFEETASNAVAPLADPQGSGDQYLKIQMVGKAAAITYQCVAFYYSATDKTIRYTTSPTAIGTPTAASQKSWQLLASGVAKQGSTAIFARTGSTYKLTFTVDAGDQDPVAFATTATSRSTATGTLTC